MTLDKWKTMSRSSSLFTVLGLLLSFHPLQSQNLSLGDTVWEDALLSRDDVYQPGVDLPIVNLTVDLFRDQNGDLIPQLSEFEQSTQTNGSGQYLFSGLDAGIYFVAVPSGQFQLVTFTNVLSSATPNDNINNDSNAFPGGPYGPTGFMTGPIVLSVGNEPTNDGDTDPNTNLTLDLGFYNTAIPVELSNFEFASHQGEVLLKWTTLSESNNGGFIIQMSSDGQKYQDMGFVEGNGNSTVERNYQFVINDLDPGYYTFRLKQVDFDGGFEYHGALKVFVEPTSSIFVGEPYPNPFNPTSNIKLILRESLDIDISLHSILGKKIQSIYSGELGATDNHEFTISGQGIPSGRYFVRIVGSNFVQVKNIVLLK